MLTDSQGIYPQLRATLATQAALTADQITTLQNEWNTDPAMRGYKAAGTLKSAVDLLPLMNDGYGIANPTQPQNRLPLASMAQGDVKTLNARLKTRYDEAVAGGATYPAIIDKIINNDLPAAVELDNLDLNDPDTLAALHVLTQVTPALLTADEVTALTTYPDPSWQPIVSQPSRAVALFGQNVVLELADLKAAGAA